MAVFVSVNLASFLHLNLRSGFAFVRQTNTRNESFPPHLDSFLLL